MEEKRDGSRDGREAEEKKKSNGAFARLYRNAVFAGISWTLLVLVSLIWNVRENQQQTQSLAITAAEAHFHKDQAFRIWATRHGGVYVPTDERTLPNPYLSHIPRRDIEAAGISLTLMNPAYMLRQVMEEGRTLSEIRRHITSLKPLRPENTPDTWEREALIGFEQDLKEKIEFTEIEGEEYVRLMRPMITSKGCLKCHGHQDYTEGDIRGGVSVSIPMSTYLALERKVVNSLVWWHGIIWVLGLGALGLVVKRSRRLIVGRHQAEKALREYHTYLEEEIEQRTMDLRETNDRLRGEIAERKQMEQELIHLERLRAVGELSAGVSHNLNNILTNVLGPAQLLQRKIDDPKLLCEVDDIIISAKRARDLVRELHLSVRTAGEESLSSVAVDEVVQQAVQTSRPRWKDEPEGQGIAIEMVTQWGGVPSIKGTEAGLHNILTNLIFNAVDAMPEGGRIDICTQMVEDMVQIRFSDTGTGMDEETRRRVFEPFFTTKMDIGTGLGLSTVHNTVEGWGGTIEVDSTPGEGTTFILRFPILARA
jgi:signal transduction histidine kinase